MTKTPLVLRSLAVGAVSLGVLCAVTITGRAGDDVHAPRKDTARVPRQPYERYFTTDRLGREITFYVSERPASPASLPLVAFVQGSGCGSSFVERGGVVVPANGHISLCEAAQGKARTIVVEKPGVRFLDDPEGANPRRECSPTFDRELTLDRWSEAVEAAIRAAVTLPGIDGSRLLVVGHSEGGLVACRVAHRSPKVTHVAVLAGGGPSQLFDLITLARKGALFREVSDDPEQRVAHVVEQWRAIQADPDNAEKKFFGWSFRRWSSFLKSSPIEELSASEASIFVAQGAEDQAVDPASADALYAELLARGRRVVYDRVPGADHSFRIASDAGVDGWRREMDRIIVWFGAGDTAAREKK